GLDINVVALMYQMSYLIFPAVLPIAYWIIMNNKFIGEITGLNNNMDRNFVKQQLSENTHNKNKDS
ncbi:hypothetical protein MNBD_BACTEROID05-692, partial [hydrothermal vent metagenome]